MMGSVMAGARKSRNVVGKALSPSGTSAQRRAAGKATGREYTDMVRKRGNMAMAGGAGLMGVRTIRGSDSGSSSGASGIQPRSMGGTTMY